MAKAYLYFYTFIGLDLIKIIYVITSPCQRLNSFCFYVMLSVDKDG